MSRFVRLPLHGTWWLPVLGAPAIVLQFLAAALGFLAIATVVCRQEGFECRWDNLGPLSVAAVAWYQVGGVVGMCVPLSPSYLSYEQI